MSQGSEMARFSCCLPTKITFGVGAVQSTGTEAAALGDHAMVVAAAESMAKSGALREVADSLEHAGVRATVYDRVQSDPTVSAIDEVAAVCRQQRCRLVVGLGGGSAIDFAKGVAVGATHPGTVHDYMGGPGHTPKPVTEAVLPVVAIPTTAGTGAEVTAVAVITIPETHEKHGIITPRVFPKVAVIDPQLMVSLPALPTAGTGFDAIGHALEAFVSKFTTPMADLFALEALRIAAQTLQRVVVAPTDLDARGRMAWAATLGGAAIANAGMTVAHGIAQALGARFHVPHGEAVALCLPETLETLLTARASRLAKVAEVMGFATGRKSEAERARSCIQGLKTLRRAVHLEMRLETLGVCAAGADQLVEDVFATQQWSLEHHPAKLERRDVRDMLMALL